MSYERTAEPIKLGYLFDFRLPDLSHARHEVAVVEQLLRLADERQGTEDALGEQGAARERHQQGELEAQQPERLVAQEVDADACRQQVDDDEVGDQPAPERHA